MLAAAMKLKRLPTWRAVFKSDAKPQHSSANEHRFRSSSTDSTNPEDVLQKPLHPTRAALLPSTPTASSALEPTAPNAHPEPLKEPDEAFATRSLWNRAYDSLRHKDEQLVVTYEELLSRELPPETIPQTLEQASNRIDNTNLVNRQEQLRAIIRNGLRQMGEGKTKYIIFGHIFVPRDQIARTAQLVQSIRTFVDQAVKVSPEASLVWAGICTILPVLTNPIAAEEANRDGFMYVTSRIGLYVEFEHLLWPASLATDLRREIEGRLVDLYEHILEFQVRTVLRFYQTRLARLGKDIVKPEIWKGMLSKIQDLEKVFDSDVKKINDSSSRIELESLNKKADQFLTGIGRILSALETNNRPASSLHNHGPGHQLNNTGGIQNNNMGTGHMFPGARFDGPVQFDRKDS